MTVTSPIVITVTVTPNNISVNTGAQQQFTATVTGTSNTSVTWSITGIGCVSQSCGTISQTGLYTAPPTLPTPSYLNVVATSVADPTKSGSATVTIVALVSVTITPTSATVITGGQQQFTASVSGSQNQNVTWTVSGTGCNGVACGTVSNSGLYTAPASVPGSPLSVSLRRHRRIRQSRHQPSSPWYYRLLLRLRPVVPSSPWGQRSNSRPR